MLHYCNVLYHSVINLIRKQQRDVSFFESKCLAQEHNNRTCRLLESILGWKFKNSIFAYTWLMPVGARFLLLSFILCDLISFHVSIGYGI